MALSARWKKITLIVVIAPFWAVGVYDVGKHAYRLCQGPVAKILSLGIHKRPPADQRTPGPARNEDAAFELDETGAVRMVGKNNEWDERWCDVAGNYYSEQLVAGFSYEDDGDDGPRVFLRVDKSGRAFSGRLEARGLKPFFAYQIKLNGKFSDRRSFEIIGRRGRWRLPGRGTNYTDLDYLHYQDKDKVNAYILFDFFVTDINGDAVREFKLDSTLHVLYNWQRQRRVTLSRGMVTAVVDASDPKIYARPKSEATVEHIWGEPEWQRYRNPQSIIRLPVGHYSAKLTLTEESFHSVDRDGGYWATVYSAPVEFDIVD